MDATTAKEAGSLERSVSLLEERFHPAAVLLFGSRATRTERPESDFDIGLVFAGPGPDAFELAGARTDLEAMLGHAVNLVALASASPILRMEALRAHRMLRCGDRELFERFVVRALGDYFDLKRVREPIERGLLSRGFR